MNASLRRRLFVWLSVAILTQALLATGLSFVLAYDDADDVQDAQLVQLASVLSTESVSATPRKYVPKDHEEAENHLVVKALGAPTDPDPMFDVPLPTDLTPGLHSIRNGDEEWRVMVSVDAAGRRFGVAQRTVIQLEMAGESATLTLIPLLVLVPILLFIVAFILRKGFAPLAELCVQVDRVDGSAPVVLDARRVPLESLPLVQAVDRLMARLGALIEQQRRLVADAAHELRTPVAALIVQADNVAHVPLPPEAQSRMDTLRRGLSRISSLIDQLLDLARLQADVRSASEPLELDQLTRVAIEETLPMARAKGVDLGCPRIDRVVIEGDGLHAYALVRNAIDNAVRYTPSGGSVDVSVFVEGGEAHLVVEDTGPGIDAADIERVFEPFVRVLGSQESGSGLGLAIARKAASALGGAIRLSRRLDEGSGLRFAYRQLMPGGRATAPAGATA